MERERLDDIYFRLDYPVLLEVGRWELAGRPDRFLRPETIADKLGQPLAAVTAALGRLLRRGYIDAADGSDNSGEYYMVHRMEAAGLEETGAWPTPATLRDRILAELEAAADRIAEAEPDKSRRLRQVVEFLRFSATEIISETVAKVLRPGP
jgi:DNA-binding MarR family transcriptional regulator